MFSPNHKVLPKKKKNWNPVCRLVCTDENSIIPLRAISFLLNLRYFSVIICPAWARILLKLLLC